MSCTLEAPGLNKSGERGHDYLTRILNASCPIFWMKASLLTAHRSGCESEGK